MEIAICDMCKKRMPLRARWRERDDLSLPFRIGRRVLHLGVTVYQHKPGIRRMRPRGSKHLDLCKPCTLKAVLAAVRSVKK